MTRRSTIPELSLLPSLSRLLLPLLLWAPVACGHTHSVGDTDAKVAAKSEETPPGKPKAAPAEHHKVARADQPVAGDDTGIPIATSPAGLLKPHGVEDIQEKLESKGHLASGAASGKLDGPTREALRAFQRDSGLPATGVPDDATVQKLGLRPSDVFRASDGQDAKK